MYRSCVLNCTKLNRKKKIITFDGLKQLNPENAVNPPPPPPPPPPQKKKKKKKKKKTQKKPINSFYFIFFRKNKISYDWSAMHLKYQALYSRKK